MSSDRRAAWQLRITDSGLVCALGLEAVSACAAADAGLSRAGALRSLNASMDAALGGEAIVGHALPCGRAEGLVGLAKALALGRLALADLARHRGVSASTPGGTVALYLALNDRHAQDRAAQSPDAAERDPADAAEGDAAAQLPSARWAAEAARLAQRLAADPAARQLGINGCRVTLGGHAAIAHALDEAARHLASGRIARAYVAAIDCLIEPRELQAAATLQQLKTSERAVGFMPGEAAVCLCVDGFAAGTAPTAGVAAGGIVVGGLGARRCATDAPPHVRGRALAEAMREAAEGWAPGAAARAWDLAGDLNGEAARAEEWGHCAVAWQGAHGGTLATPEWIAASVGECGTATPAVQLALLLHRAHRGRRSAQPTLLPLSSANGDKAALVAH